LHLVKAIPSLGEFAQGTAAEIFNPYVALQAWAGTPARGVLAKSAQLLERKRDGLSLFCKE
jgi:hypothetical protein